MEQARDIRTIVFESLDIAYAGHYDDFINESTDEALAIDLCDKVAELNFAEVAYVAQHVSAWKQNLEALHGN